MKANPTKLVIISIQFIKKSSQTTPLSVSVKGTLGSDQPQQQRQELVTERHGDK